MVEQWDKAGQPTVIRCDLTPGGCQGVVFILEKAFCLQGDSAFHWMITQVTMVTITLPWLPETLEVFQGQRLHAPRRGTALKFGWSLCDWGFGPFLPRGRRGKGCGTAVHCRHVIA